MAKHRASKLTPRADFLEYRAFKYPNNQLFIEMRLPVKHRRDYSYQELNTTNIRGQLYAITEYKTVKL